jgi:hydroxyacylglutathione hydrolase
MRTDQPEDFTNLSPGPKLLQIDILRKSRKVESVPRLRIVRVSLICASVLALIVAIAIAAPYWYAEYGLRQHGERVGPRPSNPVRGRWFDDYYVVETLDATTYAIGEPRYYQGNYSYLILGTKAAVLFDGGTGSRDIVPVVRSLTPLPVTVVPSHLHFDHVGGLGRFDKTALLDDPDLRSRLHDGVLRLDRYEFLGFADGLESPHVRVDEWWRPGTTINLGDRQLKVLHTPGHTPTSLSLYDEQRHLLFCGDFVYPGNLYAFLPGASRSAYRRTTEQLIAIIDPSTQILAAHMADAPAVISAPRLAISDLRALLTTLQSIDAGSANSTGIYPRVFEVNGAMRFATGFAWNNR